MRLAKHPVPYMVAFLRHELLAEPQTNCGGCDR